MLSSFNLISVTLLLTLILHFSPSYCINCNIASIPQKAYNNNYLNPKFYMTSDKFCNNTFSEIIVFNFSSPNCSINKTLQFDCTRTSSGTLQLYCENNVTGVDQVKMIFIKGIAHFIRGNVSCDCQGVTSIKFVEFIPTPQPGPVSWPILLVVMVIGFAGFVLKKCSRRDSDNNDLLLQE